jgi:hypothetical protein
MIGGLFFAWLHRCSSPYDFECRACGAGFTKRTAAAKVAYVALWVLAGFVVAFVLLSVAVAILDR